MEKLAKKTIASWDSRLRGRLANLGWTVVELARRMGHEDQAFRDRLYKYVKGRVKNPRGEMLEEIAKAVGWDVGFLRYGISPPASESRSERWMAQMLSPDNRADDQPDDVRSEDVAASLTSRPSTRKVKLKGYVGAGGQAHYYALADEDFEEVDAPIGASDQTVAVEIKGASLGPLLESWLVYYQDVRSPVEADLLGVLCVVGLDDDRILVKKILSNGRGGYTLMSNNTAEPPIENAKIEWAAKVTDMKPRR